MKKRTIFTTLLGIAAIGMFSVSCETDGNNSTGTKSAEKPAAKSPAFLVSNYEPLDEWLDERFEAKYRNMTPSMIFDQVPIDQIYYDLEGLPKDGPKFDLESNNISRREILKEIADFWDLEMTIQNGADGNPSVVKVRGS